MCHGIDNCSFIPKEIRESVNEAIHTFQTKDKQSSAEEILAKTRLSRLGEEETEEALSLMETLNDDAIEDKNTPMAGLGKLLSMATTIPILPKESKNPFLAL